MDVKRFWRHVVMTPWAARRAFPRATLESIRRTVTDLERRHRGEVRFVVEAELTTLQLWRGLDSRQRAIELFHRLGVRHTQEATGVLVYLLLADQKVEIIADRGVSAKVDPAQWQGVCRTMQEAFRAGRFEEGAVAGVSAIAALLAEHFPARGENPNELPDRPILL